MSTVSGGALADPMGRFLPVFRLVSWLAIVAMAAVLLWMWIAGWWLGWASARTLVPGAEAIKPATTGTFLAAAVSFGLLWPGTRHVVFRVAGLVLAAVVVVGGWQDLYDWINHGLRETHSLFGGVEGVPTSGNADFRSPETGIVLLCSGFALAFYHVGLRRWQPGRLLALVPLTFGLYELISYMIPASRIYWTGSYAGMALGTALCATLLGIALVLVPYERWTAQLLVGEGPGGVLVRRLLPLVITISVLLGLFSAQATRIDIPRNQRGLVVTALTVLLLGTLVWSFARSLERGTLERRIAQRTIESTRADVRRMEREAQTIIDSAPDAFVGSDEIGRVTRWNRRAEEMFGWSRQEALGRPVAELFIPERHHWILDAMLQGTDRGILGQRREVTARRKDGSEFAVELELWRLEDSRASTYNAFLTDISQRKALERALVAARDEAVEAAQAKSRFLATMSHEIRTPMNGVIGLTDLLLETPLNQSQRRYADGIQTAGAALLSIINDILDFSKLEAGKITIEQTTFDLSLLVEEVTEVFANGAEEKGLELIADCDPTMPERFVGDPTRLRQIMLNFTSNALKFTNQGEIIVRVYPDREPSPDADTVPVRLEVVDTGIGIPAEKREQLFEPFTQADVSTTREFGGSGLGLAICYRLTEAMGGLIGVDSTPGEGSTFWCVIPLRRAPEHAAAMPPPGPRDLRVLVVDDNESNRHVLEGQLRGWTMRPTSVGDGRDALEALRAAADHDAPFALAVIDMTMPGMDGIELGETITTDSRIPPLDLVLLTSVNAPDPEAARDAGFVATLPKPVRRSRLHEILAEVTTTGRPGERPAPARPPAATEPEFRPPTQGNVLVVEDNEINQAVAMGFLARLGYRADVAANGRQALDKIAKNRYGAVLMDCQMPIMDGYTATTELRRREGPARHTPVIAMTAGALAENRDRCLAAGMDDFIPKPIGQDALATALSRWMPHTGPNGPPSPPGAAAPAPGPEAPGPEAPGPEAPGPEAGESVQPASESIRERLDELGGSDSDQGREALTRIASMFITREGADIEELAGAVARQDSAAIQRCAHRIKGAAANIGATAMSAAAREVENIGKQRRPESAPDALDRLRHEFRQASEALSAILGIPATGELSSELSCNSSCESIVRVDRASRKFPLRGAPLAA
ncbi:MAG TPA: response regulator [Streptosporangiaceae bacterium]|nr:response regulator [Streptosporangiaceae bacterium]